MKAPPYLRLWLGTFLLAISAAVAAQNATTTRPVDLRAGPDRTYPLVMQLEADTPVQVMGCLDDWSWCDVSAEDNRGWVYAPTITYEYEGGYVPLYSYAPGLGIPVVAFSIDGYWGRYYHERPWYAQRDDWTRRGPPHHERPPGPRPAAGPPPRSVRIDRPRAESESRLHLGSAAPTRGAEPLDRAKQNGDGRPPEPRHRENSPPANQHHGEYSTPAERPESPHREDRSRPPEHETPPRHEERSPAPQRAEVPRHKEDRADRPGENQPRGTN